LNIDDAEAKKFCELVNGFRPALYAAGEIPYKGEYNDIRTACVPLSVMARTDLPDDLVYKMAKALAENVKDLEQVSPSMRAFEPKNLSRVISPKAKFHPGAEKYYRERGWR
jgi:TRAP-type uncharacterized transport system substrate-binding protein